MLARTFCAVRPRAARTNSLRIHRMNRKDSPAIRHRVPQCRVTCGDRFNLFGEDWRFGRGATIRIGIGRKLDITLAVTAWSQITDDFSGDVCPAGVTDRAEGQQTLKSCSLCLHCFFSFSWVWTLLAPAKRGARFLVW